MVVTLQRPARSRVITKRTIVTITACILVVMVLLDPYTFFLNASDAVSGAPWWQTAFGLTDIMLLVWVVRLVWRKQGDVAIWAMIAEIWVSLTFVGLTFWRDGAARFGHGVAAESDLGFYVQAFAIRAVLFLVLRLL